MPLHVLPSSALLLVTLCLSHSVTEEFRKCSVIERRYCVPQDKVCKMGAFIAHTHSQSIPFGANRTPILKHG